jgi:hypothetical protein
MEQTKGSNKYKRKFIHEFELLLNRANGKYYPDIQTSQDGCNLFYSLALSFYFFSLLYILHIIKLNSVFVRNITLTLIEREDDTMS